MVTNPQHKKLLLLYFRYKDSPFYAGSIISVIFITAVVLLWQVVIPQVYDFFSVNNEIQETRGRIRVMKNNVTYLNTLSSANLDSDIQLTFFALPSEKDFSSIISAVNTSALDSGVEVNDYSLVIGELATPSGVLKNYYSVDLALTVSGNLQASKGFLTRIHEILPLSQVQGVSLNEQDTTMKLSFYVKSFPQGKYDVVNPLRPIPPNDAALFNILSRWKNDAPLSNSFDVPPDISENEPPF